MATAYPLPAGHVALGRWLLLFCLILSPLLFCRGALDAFEETKVALLVLEAVALAGLGVSAGIVRSRKRLGVPRDPVTLGFLLFTASAVVSTFTSVSPLTSWRGAAESHAGLMTILAYLVLFLATRALCQTTDDGRRLLAGAVLGAAVASTYALAQVSGRDPVAWDGTSVLGKYVRPFATMGHPNVLGAYLVMAWPLVATFAARAARKRHWLALAAMTGICGLAAAGVVASLSRAAWLAAVCMVLVLLAGWWRAGARRAGVVLGAALVLGGAVGVGGSLASPEFRARLAERVRHLSDGAGREHVWRAAWDLFRARPVRGWGVDAFRLAFGTKRPVDYWRVEWNATPTRAHNEVLHVLATQGLLGGAAVVVLLVGLGRAGARAWRRAEPGDRPLVAAVIAGLVSFLVQDLFGFTTASCGTLFVTGAALLSRWAEDRDGTSVVAPFGQGVLTSGLLVGGGAALLVFLANTGFAGLPVCLVLAVVGGLTARTTLQLHLRDQPGAPATGLSDPSLALRAGKVLPLSRLDFQFFCRVLARVGIGAAATAAAWVWVVRPFLASIACQTGDQLLADSPRRALPYYEKAVALDPDGDRNWTKLGGAAQLAARSAETPVEGQDRLRKAHRALEQAAELVPVDPYRHANLARLLGDLARRGLARPDEATAEWSMALAADPNNLLFLAEAARTALALGDWERARRYAGRSIELYPDFGSGHALLGLTAYAEGNWPESVRELKVAVHANWHEDGEGYYQALTALAAANFGLGRLDEARQAAAEVIRHQPGWATPHLLLAQILEGTGRKEMARDEYRLVLTLAPGHPEARSALQRLSDSH